MGYGLDGSCPYKTQETYLFTYLFTYLTLCTAKGMQMHKYTKNTELMIKEVVNTGFNMWAMLGLFKKRSKLSEPIPDEVIQAVCREYLKRVGSIDKSFPYFLTVLTEKSRDYFAQRNIRDHAKIKSQPTKLKIRIG